MPQKLEWDFYLGGRRNFMLCTYAFNLVKFVSIFNWHIR